MSGATPSLAIRFQCMYKHYAFVMETKYVQNEVRNNISNMLEYRIGSRKIPLPLHASHLNILQTVEVCNWICKWLKQNNKSGIQFDIKTPPAPIHTISYKFILTTLQNLIKSRVHVYYIVYRITKTVRNIKHYVRFHFNITAKEGARDYFG